MLGIQLLTFFLNPFAYFLFFKECVAFENANHDAKNSMLSEESGIKSSL
ncbi:hypothetical protein CCA_00840 [Chlamydia caviae GPIC]|uniref:Uncharacterized protein n=1 Tax=Chlamydia caviae (strain ATCC VR-813 / DSM 19441 / 03DC25 / GPIC) TaxID=227941 RepID=Q821U5_CHLCV|nr:hypothetical protein CCA_00840 [Chlamydia caviae GPIC]